MNIDINEKYKIHINELYDCNKEQALDYCFTKYYEFENKDEELSDYFFVMVGKLITGTYFKPETQTTKINITPYERKLIIDASYQFKYENATSLSGPLKNIYGELLDPTVEEPFIVPYMQLIKIMQNNKEKSSKIAN